MSKTENEALNGQNQPVNQENAPEKKSKKKTKKIIRKILKFFAWIAAVILALVIILLCFRDSIIKSGITGIGSWVTSSEITLEKFETSLLDGEIKIINLHIANPKGFAMPTLLKLESFYLKLNMPSIFSNTVNIETIDVSGLSVVGEFNTQGKFNAVELVQNIKNKFPSSAPTPQTTENDSPEDSSVEPESDDVEQKNVDIGSISVTNSSATITDDRVGIPVQIPLYFSSADLSLEVTDINLLEQLDTLAKQLEYSCTGIANAGELVIDTGKQIINNTSDAGKQIINSTTDTGKKLLDNTGNAGKQLLNKAVDLFDIKK